MTQVENPWIRVAIDLIYLNPETCQNLPGGGQVTSVSQQTAVCSAIPTGRLWDVSQIPQNRWGTAISCISVRLFIWPEHTWRHMRRWRRERQLMIESRDKKSRGRGRSRSVLVLVLVQTWTGAWQLENRELRRDPNSRSVGRCPRVSSCQRWPMPGHAWVARWGGTRSKNCCPRIKSEDVLMVQANARSK